MSKLPVSFLLLIVLIASCANEARNSVQTKKTDSPASVISSSSGAPVAPMGNNASSVPGVSAKTSAVVTNASSVVSNTVKTAAIVSNAVPVKSANALKSAADIKGNR